MWLVARYSINSCWKSISSCESGKLSDLIIVSAGKRALTTTTTPTTTPLPPPPSDAESKENEKSTKKDKTQIVDGFRVYELSRKSSEVKRIREKPIRGNIDYLRDERFRKMSADQDWTSVWPANNIFKQSVVPLPMHQGVVRNKMENEGIPPGKYANAELMKIPNFLHLTPNHIKQHCAAIKKFCTPWPKELATDKDCSDFFPIEITTTDYLYDGPSIRDERARHVTLKVPIESLELDEHAKNKFIKLAGELYDPNTKILTLKSDRCPYRKQNNDYVKYLLTVLYYESWKVEEWEADMSEDDWSRYQWHKSKSKRNIDDIIAKIDKTSEEEVKSYAQSTTNLFDNGDESIDEFKQSVLKLLKLKPAGDAAKQAEN